MVKFVEIIKDRDSFSLREVFINPSHVVSLREDNFMKRISLVGDGPGIAFLRPSFDEEEFSKIEDDEDTSHLSDERNHRHSPFPQTRKRKCSYSFVR